LWWYDYSQSALMNRCKSMWNYCHIGSCHVFQLKGAVNHDFVQNSVSWPLKDVSLQTAAHTWFVHDGVASLFKQFWMTGAWNDGQVQTDCQAHKITWLQPTGFLFMGPA
jgi:hypothetical protein